MYAQTHEAVNSCLYMFLLLSPAANSPFVFTVLTKTQHNFLVLSHMNTVGNFISLAF